MEKDWFSDLTLTIDNDKKLLDTVINAYIDMLTGGSPVSFKTLIVRAGYPRNRTVSETLYSDVSFHYLMKVLIDHSDRVDPSSIVLLTTTSPRYHLFRKALSVTAHVIDYPSHVLEHYKVFPNQDTEKTTNLECIQQGEIPMFSTDSSKAFDKVTGYTVYGIDTQKLTEAQAIEAINKVNLEIDNLESVQVESKRITNMVSDLKKQKAEIVKLLDSGKLAS